MATRSNERERRSLKRDREREKKREKEKKRKRVRRICAVKFESLAKYTKIIRTERFSKRERARSRAFARSAERAARRAARFRASAGNGPSAACFPCSVLLDRTTAVLSFPFDLPSYRPFRLSFLLARSPTLSFSLSILRISLFLLPSGRRLPFVRSLVQPLIRERSPVR